ncbi:hypothetical protein [Methylorubrum extorquens]|uniref:hypothetical protein n=1 Tax=Methylorubrum extorquens TaxID=408 RepID=UPI001EE519AB|nr:hypothetical protein [Methylorubrum extorquens]MCG5249522.1 hypothetical protein [Methylorubrum extorquens]
MTDTPLLGVPPGVRALLSGAELYGGCLRRDLYCAVAYFYPPCVPGDWDELLLHVGGDDVAARLIRALWKSCADALAGQGRAASERVFVVRLHAIWEHLVRLLDGRRAAEIELELYCGEYDAIDEIVDRLTLALAITGEAEALARLERVLWRQARMTNLRGREAIHQAAFGASLSDASARITWRPAGSVIDVVGQWREAGRRAMALALGESPETEAAAPAPSALQRIEAASAAVALEGPGVVVVPRVGGGAKGQSNKDAAAELKDVAGISLPLYEFPRDRRALVEEAAAEAPHARPFFERLVALQDTREHWALPPILSLGDPGGGKTTALDRFFRSAGVYVERYACDGSSDSAAAGTPRRWQSSEVCLPLRAAMTAGHANPAILWDEVNRAGGHRQGSGGTLRDALTSFLEPANSARYRDPYVEAEVDVSHVLHVATANGTDGIASQVLDRLVVLEFPLPTREHLPVLARRMAIDIARRQGLPDDHGELDRAELQALSEHWPGGSLRGLRRLVEVAVQVRLQAPWSTRH